jgi:hypothetical protein
MMLPEINIFVSYELSMNDFVKEMESLLEVDFQHVSDQDSSDFDRYEFSSETLLMILTKAIDFENDRDMNFEDYQYHISISVLRFSNEQDLEQVRNDFARFVFERLKATGQYHMMMTYNLQRKLNEFCPKSVMEN